MKNLTKLALVLIPAITLSNAATAHEPGKQTKKAEKADCSKMKHGKMDMKDPEAIAMMKKCMKQTSLEKSSENKPLYWVAPMDPNYRRDKPGKSPMGMDLVPVYKDKD
tara:strand:- start:1387 stop:1710 length:324 start_codon:yes stop_codon:yes gene_type:complete